MFTKIKNFFLKIKCRKIYKNLPEMVKMQLYLEMNKPSNSNATYADILKREFELQSEVDRRWEMQQR